MNKIKKASVKDESKFRWYMMIEANRHYISNLEQYISYSYIKKHESIVMCDMPSLKMAV